MKHLLMVGAAAVALGAAAPASAQIFGFSPSGAYVAGDVGYHFAEPFEGESNVGNRRFDFDSEDDYAAFGRLGYRINPNLRAEFEYGYRPGEIESVRGPAGQVPQALCRAGVARTAAAPACQSPQGDLRAASFMFNVIYDLFDETARLRPFIGAGVGVAEVHNKVYGQLSNVGTTGAGGALQFQNASFDDIETGFAYQGILGVAFQVTDRLALDVTGRYLAADELEFGSVTENAGSRAGTITNLGTFEGDYRDASVTVGLRYQFGAPAAPPPPPPPPTPPAPPAEPPAPPPPPPPVAQEFIVYFPFDQYVLTPEAQTVVQQAAQYAAQGGTAQVVIVGHADTSGSAAYNVRLSERRSKAVADAMAGLGVPQTALSVDWRGETQPAVPTPDGTKEPLNRRTTITVNPGAGAMGMQGSAMPMQDPAMTQQPGAAPMQDPAMMQPAPTQDPAATQPAPAPTQ